MISAKELRNVNAAKYSIEEITYIIQQASDTIEAYEKENKEIYEKMEFLAGKIEDYREEEDSIKAALITAEKSAEHTRKEAQQKADDLIEQSETTAKKALDDAQSEANKVIAEARDYATNLVSEKTKEAEDIITEAEKKSNEAINSAKVVAQNIMDQAKEISTDLLAKSKEEKLAYSVLVKNIKNDAKEFVDKLKGLYDEQLEALNGANFESADDENEVDDIQDDVDSLVKEIDEMKDSFPRSIYLDDLEQQTKEIEDKQEEQADDSADAQISDDAIDEIEEEVYNEPQVIDSEKIAQKQIDDELSNIANSTDEEINDKDKEDINDSTDVEALDPMEAVNAFSSKEYIPYEKTNGYISEIDEEPEMEDVYSNPQEDESKSLFDDDNAMSFEQFFNVKSEADDDRTETISLIPPDEMEEKEEPKFKGFFGRRKNK